MDKYVHIEENNGGVTNKFTIEIDTLSKVLTPEQLEYLSKPRPTIKEWMWVYREYEGRIYCYKTHKQLPNGEWRTEREDLVGFDPATYPRKVQHIYPCPPEVAEWAEKVMEG